MKQKSKRIGFWSWSAILGATILGLASLGGSDSPTQSANVIQAVGTQNETVNERSLPSHIETVSATKEKETPKPIVNSRLSNDNYYTNVDGQSVHSPAYSIDGSVPAGASARCRDGTYSFSQNRRGTCSRHGGVSHWY